MVNITSVGPTRRSQGRSLPLACIDVGESLVHLFDTFLGLADLLIQGVKELVLLAV